MLSESTPFGLPSDFVRDIRQDRSSNIWIATDRGLARFDYWRATHYFHEETGENRGSTHITTVATNSKVMGPVWLSNYEGLLKLDQQTGTFSRYNRKSGHPLASDHFTDLAISEENTLWIGTDQGLSLLNLNSEAITRAEGELENEAISFVTSFEGTDIRVGTKSGKLFPREAGASAFQRRWETSVAVSFVVKDAENRLWIGTEGNGLFRRDTPESAATIEIDIGAKTIMALHVESESRNVRVGTREGLAVFNRSDGTLGWLRHSPHHGESLAHNHVTTIYEDYGKILWVGTENGGTSRFSLEQEWDTRVRANPDQENGLPDSLISRATITAEGKIRFATRKGLALWVPVSSEFLSPGASLESISDWVTTTLTDEDGNHGVGKQGGGFFRIAPDGAKTHFRHDPGMQGSLGHDNISASFESPDGTLYFGTRGAGLQRFDPGMERFAGVTTETGPEGDFIHSLTADPDGNIRVSTETSIFLLPAGEAQMIPFEERFPDAQRLSGRGPVAILHEKNGVVWIGTSNQNAGHHQQQWRTPPRCHQRNPRSLEDRGRKDGEKPRSLRLRSHAQIRVRDARDESGSETDHVQFFCRFRNARRNHDRPEQTSSDPDQFDRKRLKFTAPGGGEGGQPLRARRTPERSHRNRPPSPPIH